MREIELLAPGGDINALKAAIYAGADAVYCGLNKFNARNRAKNISFEELNGIIRLAHKYKCKVFLTLNIIILDREIPELLNLLNKLVNKNIDGVIAQDFGVMYLINRHFKNIQIHASTQLTTHNEGQIRFLKRFNTIRVNLSRELNLNEIKQLNNVAFQNGILTEVFVHGSYCISFSGACYMSSVQSGKSGNRGQCSQPCRDRYLSTATQKNYPLNLKDNSAFFDLKELRDAGVYSFKIEGRIKEYEYVYTIVNAWRKQINSLQRHNTLLKDNSDLYKVFNRDFSNDYLKGSFGKKMFIDNPMTNSGKHHSKENISVGKNESPIDDLYEQKERTRIFIKNEIDKLSIQQIPVELTISGKNNEPLKVSVKSDENSFDVYSNNKLTRYGHEALNQKTIAKKLNAINDTDYCIEQLFYENENEKLYLPFSDLNTIKKDILYTLNNSKEYIEPVKLNKLKRTNVLSSKPKLAILISSVKDITISEKTTCEIHFQLPDSLKNNVNDFVELFNKNKSLIPVFPTILIGEDYHNALELLQQIHPSKIITNNTGIAYEAAKLEMPWIAGPYLNLVNSYSFLCLQELYNCAGAFVSNEISKTQIRGIRKPENFDLYYSIYHPIELMISRQCLFQQVTTCSKTMLDKSCIQDCQKTTTITKFNKNNYIIYKEKGKYNRIFNENNYLNLDVVSDYNTLFSLFSIDLRAFKTKTEVEENKLLLINHFEEFISGNSSMKEKLNECIKLTTNTQYIKGI